MKELIKSYWITAILLLAPIIRHFTENTTIDALTGLVVWSLMGLLAACGFLILIAGFVFNTWHSEIKQDGFEKLAKPFRKLKWWKTAIHATLILGAYIYIEWTGPAILYTISLTILWCGLMLLKSGLSKAMEAAGIELPADLEEAPVDLKDDLKKSSLL